MAGFIPMQNSDLVRRDKMICTLHDASRCYKMLPQTSLKYPHSIVLRYKNISIFFNMRLFANLILNRQN